MYGSATGTKDSKAIIQVVENSPTNDMGNRNTGRQPTSSAERKAVKAAKGSDIIRSGFL